MPIPLIAAAGVALGAAAMGATAGVAIAAAVVVGMASFLMVPNAKTGGGEAGGLISPVDVGIGFSPFPTYPSNETPVPVIFGRGKVNCPVVHKRAYGSDYDRAHFLGIISEVGTTPHEIRIDNVNILDFPNYYTRVGGEQNEHATWYNVYPQGGVATMILNNSGSFGIGAQFNSVTTHPLDIPFVFYGGGFLSIETLHSFGPSKSYQQWRWEFTNLDEPTEWVYGPVHGVTFEESMKVATGGKNSKNKTKYVAGQRQRWERIESPKFRPGSRWIARLNIQAIGGVGEGSSIGVRLVEVVDSAIIEQVRINSAFIHVHIKKEENLAGDNPNISVTCSVATISGTGGNPADSLYSFLTDPVRGIGLPGGRVDYNSVLDMIYWCENNGLGFNRVYGQTYSYDQVVKEMTAAGRIMLIREDGILRMYPDKKELTSYVVKEFGEIVPGSIKVALKSSITPNRVEVQYVEPYYDYTVQRIPLEGIEQAAEFGLQTTSVDLAGVTDQGQAFGLGYIILQQMLQCPYTCEFTVGFNTARKLRVGRVIEVDSESSPLLRGLKWRIYATDEVAPHLYNIKCVQYKDSVYDVPSYTPWYHDIGSMDTVRALTAGGWPGATTGPASVAALQIDKITYPNTVDSELTVSWVTPTERYTSVRIDVNWDGNKWETVGSFQLGPCTFRIPMHYAQVTVRAVTLWNNLSNIDVAPQASVYATGLMLEGDIPNPQPAAGGDMRGFGNGQFENQPFGM